MTVEVFTSFTTAMGSLLSNIGLVLAGLITWSTSMLTMIISNPILLLPCIFGFVGVVVITVRAFLR